MKKGAKPVPYEEVSRRFAAKGLKLLDESVTSSKQKLTAIDNEGYYYSCNYNNLSGKMPERFNKFNPYVIQNIQHYLDNHSNGTKIVSTRFDGSKALLEFICPYCGQLFKRTWDEVHLRHRYKCHDCTKAMDWGNGFKLTYDEVKQRVKSVGYELLSTNYHRNTDILLCRTQDGYIFSVVAANLFANPNMTPSLFSPQWNAQYYIHNINHYFQLKQIDCKALYYVFEDDRYDESTPTVYCQCSCGREFHTTWDSIKCGQVRCPHCSSGYSRIELKVGQWLEKKHIQFIRQYKFDDCRDKRPLPFDYYLPKYNLCIEVDGRQHESVERFGGLSKTNAQEAFNKLKKHDAIKTQYCQEHNIDLLRIAERDIARNENYKKILYDKLIKK